MKILIGSTVGGNSCANGLEKCQPADAQSRVRAPSATRHAGLTCFERSPCVRAVHDAIPISVELVDDFERIFRIVIFANRVLHRLLSSKPVVDQYEISVELLDAQMSQLRVPKQIFANVRQIVPWIWVFRRFGEVVIRSHRRGARGLDESWRRPHHGAGAPNDVVCK